MDNIQCCWYIHTETRIELLHSKGQRVTHYHILKFDPKNDMIKMYVSTTPQGEYWHYTKFHSKMAAIQNRIYNNEHRGKDSSISYLSTHLMMDTTVEDMEDNVGDSCNKNFLDKSGNVSYSLLNYLKDKWFSRGD
jgi:hypothetical protein